LYCAHCLSHSTSKKPSTIAALYSEDCSTSEGFVVLGTLLPVWCCAEPGLACFLAALRLCFCCFLHYTDCTPSFCPPKKASVGSEGSVALGTRCCLRSAAPKPDWRASWPRFGCAFALSSTILTARRLFVLLKRPRSALGIAQKLHL
jgi:hypothetical protein